MAADDDGVQRPKLAFAGTDGNLGRILEASASARKACGDDRNRRGQWARHRHRQRANSRHPHGAVARSAAHPDATSGDTPFAAHIPVYVAKAKGYYDADGLDVDILSGRGSVFAATTVGAGKEEFGISDAASVLVARAKGVPVIAIGNLQQDNGVALIATEKSGISKVEDLKGRNIGILPGSTTTIFLQALLKKHGMTMDDFKAITWRPGTDLPLLLDAKIDSEVTVYNNEVIAWGKAPGKAGAISRCKVRPR